MRGSDSIDIKEALEKSGALRKGHFRLSSGLHSDTYVQCSQLLKDPKTAVEAGRLLAAESGRGVDLVLCPAIGAVLIGFTTALALGVDMIFAERVGGEMTLRRSFEIKPGTAVLLVEDVITTGGSIMELARLVEESGSEVAALACIVDRGGGEGAPYPVVSLLRIEASSFTPEDCPLCSQGVPMDAPGSRHTA